MKIKKAIKVIGTLALGATMLSGTIAGAVAVTQNSIEDTHSCINVVEDDAIVKSFESSNQLLEQLSEDVAVVDTNEIRYSQLGC